MMSLNYPLINRFIIGAILSCLLNNAVANNKLSDPTKPINYWTWYSSEKNTAYKKSSTLKLQSILISENRKTAIINGKTAIVGSNINGANIIAINNNNVVIHHDGRDKTLRLPNTNAVRKLQEAKVNVPQ